MRSRGDDLRPPVLSIHLEPDRERVGLCCLASACRGRRDDDRERDRGGDHREYPVSHAKSPSIRRRACGASKASVTGGRTPSSGASSRLLPIGHRLGISHTRPLLSRSGVGEVATRAGIGDDLVAIAAVDRVADSGVAGQRRRGSCARRGRRASATAPRAPPTHPRWSRSARWSE